MPRTKKATSATAEPTTISIKDAVTQLQTSEQALRLALSHIRPDDFDTVKALPELDFQELQKVLNRQLLSEGATDSANSLENAPNAETSTQQDSHPATEGATNAPIGNLTQPTQPKALTQPNQAAQTNQVSLVEMLARQATEEIEAIDGLARVKNAVILNNLQARDAELSQQIQERHSDRKHQIMGSIRDVASLAQDKPEITSDDFSLSSEIDDLINQLGKSLLR
jgi:hypothetical protein